jgi:hypothetical protein
LETVDAWRRDDVDNGDAATPPHMPLHFARLPRRVLDAQVEKESLVMEPSSRCAVQ